MGKISVISAAQSWSLLLWDIHTKRTTAPDGTEMSSAVSEIG